MESKAYKQAKWLSFFSTLIHQIGIRSVFPLGVLGVYVISYFKNLDKSVSIYLTFFLFPVITSLLTFSVPVAGVLEHYLGSRITLLISCLTLVLASVLTIISKSAGFTIFCYVIFGLGLGLSAMTSVKTTCQFYPNKRGLITSLMNSFSSMGVAILNILAEFVLINPQKKGMIEGEEYYSMDIAERFPNYIYLIIAIIPTFTIIAIILDSFSKSKKNTAALEEEEQRISLQPQEKVKNPSTINNPLVDPSEEKKKNSYKYKQDIKKIFTSAGIWKLFFECFLTSFLPLLVFNSYKTVGLLNGRNQTIMVITASVASVCLAGINPLWGYLYDKFSFKPLIIFMGIAGAVNGAFFFFAIFSDYLITASIVFNNSLLAAANTIFFPHIIKIYGLTYSLEASGVIGLGIGVTGIIGATFCYIVNEIFGKNLISYYVSYGVGAAMSLLSLAFSLFEKEEVFVYDECEIQEVDKLIEQENKVENA